MTFSRLLATASLALLAACGSADPETVIDSVRMTEQAQLDSLAADDVYGVMRSYRDEAVMTVPGNVPAQGKPAIEKWYTELVADPALKVTVEPGPAWVSDSGEMAVTTAKFTFATGEGEGAATRLFHNQTAWKKADGGWRILANSNTEESRTTALAQAASD